MPELGKPKQKDAPAKAEAPSSVPEGENSLTKGQKFWVIIIYILGFVVAMAIIFLGEYYHWW